MKKLLLVSAMLFCFEWSNTLNAQNPLLWGMTSAGGTDSLGTIFKINGDGTGFQSLYSFDTASGNTPWGTLLHANNNKFYGLTIQSGANNKGTIFSFDTANVFTNVHDFTGNAGNSPRGKLLQTNTGALYGMTYYDDSIGAGVIFKYNPVNNTFAKLATFNGVGNGQSPRGSLMQASNGKIYGTTQAGGSNNSGTLFSFDTVTDVITNLHNFALPTGFNPFGDLIQASNGTLYGLGMYFGTTGPGTIFSFNPTTNVFNDLIHFNMTNGAFPEGSFIQANNGKLYALTFGGGASLFGVLLSYDITANTITDLVTFNGANGERPTGSLIQASNNKLYGMTSLGGANSLGVVFSYDITTATYTVIHDFNGTDGSVPFGSLTEAYTRNTAGIASYSVSTNSFSISPNPSNGIFTLTSEIIPAEIQVTDVTGKLVYDTKPNSSQTIINLQNKAKGIYFIKVNDSKKTSTQKIIIE